MGTRDAIRWGWAVYLAWLAVWAALHWMDEESLRVASTVELGLFVGACAAACLAARLRRRGLLSLFIFVAFSGMLTSWSGMAHDLNRIRIAEVLVVATTVVLWVGAISALVSFWFGGWPAPGRALLAVMIGALFLMLNERDLIPWGQSYLAWCPMRDGYPWGRRYASHLAVAATALPIGSLLILCVADTPPTRSRNSPTDRGRSERRPFALLVIGTAAILMLHAAGHRRWALIEVSGRIEPLVPVERFCRAMSAGRFDDAARYLLAPDGERQLRDGWAFVRAPDRERALRAFDVADLRVEYARRLLHDGDSWRVAVAKPFRVIDAPAFFRRPDNAPLVFVVRRSRSNACVWKIAAIKAKWGWYPERELEVREESP